MNDIIEITRTEKIDLRPLKDKIKELENQKKDFDKALKIVEKLPEDIKPYVMVAIPDPNPELEQLKFQLDQWQK